MKSHEFMVHVNVSDETTSTNSVIFKKVAKKVFGGTVAKILHDMHQIYNLILYNINSRCDFKNAIYKFFNFKDK